MFRLFSVLFVNFLYCVTSSIDCPGKHLQRASGRCKLDPNCSLRSIAHGETLSKNGTQSVSKMLTHNFTPGIYMARRLILNEMKPFDVSVV